jgi:hypothetical protein
MADRVNKIMAQKLARAREVEAARKEAEEQRMKHDEKKT